MLVVTLFGVAVEFVNQPADFLAAVQVIVYAGAIVILFLFVIMFLGVDRSESRGQADPSEGSAARRPIVLGVVVLVELVQHRPGLDNWATGAHSVAGTPASRARATTSRSWASRSTPATCFPSR